MVAFIHKVYVLVHSSALKYFKSGNLWRHLASLQREIVRATNDREPRCTLLHVISAGRGRPYPHSRPSTDCRYLVSTSSNLLGLGVTFFPKRAILLPSFVTHARTDIASTMCSFRLCCVQCRIFISRAAQTGMFLACTLACHEGLRLILFFPGSYVFLCFESASNVSLRPSADLTHPILRCCGCRSASAFDRRCYLGVVSSFALVGLANRLPRVRVVQHVHPIAPAVPLGAVQAVCKFGAIQVHDLRYFPPSDSALSVSVSGSGFLLSCTLGRSFPYCNSDLSRLRSKQFTPAISLGVCTHTSVIRRFLQVAPALQFTYVAASM